MLTVKELLEQLASLDSQMKVVVAPNNQYSFAGSVEKAIWIPGYPIAGWGEVIELDDGEEAIAQEQQLKDRYMGAENVVVISP